MKKRLWSPEEDEKLKAFVSTHGAKRWKQVPLQAGLDRCGRSCRLRWFNFLRPGIRRGDFSPHEKQLVFELQSVHGNRWSQISKLMPGRTDAEIKNFWNNSVRKSAKSWKRLEELGQITNYRLAMPFNIELDLPNLEEEKFEHPVLQEQNITTLDSRASFNPVSSGLIFQSFFDAAFWNLLDCSQL